MMLFNCVQQLPLHACVQYRPKTLVRSCKVEAARRNVALIVSAPPDEKQATEQLTSG
jgi:hypothetical protein